METLGIFARSYAGSMRDRRFSIGGAARLLLALALCLTAPLMGVTRAAADDTPCIHRPGAKRVVVGDGVERCVEVRDGGRTVSLFLNLDDTQPWVQQYEQSQEPDKNYCGPTAGKNFLYWYGLDASYGDLGSEMRTNTWDTAPVVGAAGLVCGFEPICTAILASTVSDLAVKLGSLPRYVQSSLYGRMPGGYEACGTTGVDSLEDIRQSLIAGNPVVYLESEGEVQLHWAVITGMQASGNDTLLTIANSDNRLWSDFSTDWSLSKVANDQVRRVLSQDDLGVDPYVGIRWCRSSNASANDNVRVFDAQYYLEANPDVQAAFGNDLAAAKKHWIEHGLSEGRRGSREFDVRYYLATNPDLQAAFGTDYRAAANHWLTTGLANEGRRGSREFDVKFYLATNPDLQAAFGADYLAAIDHWIAYGLPSEGRRGSREFDVQFYLATNPDVLSAFGPDYLRAIDHWLIHGLPEEGRRGSREFDVRFYLKKNHDVKAVFDNDFASATDHWITRGLPSEGRRGAREFDVKYYFKKNRDLKAAFGRNYLALTDHWITKGLPVEGRRGARAFDVRFYLAANPGLQARFGIDYITAMDDWIARGRSAGLQGAP